MYKRAEKLLSEMGIQPSFQRMAIVDYLMKHKTHPTADEVFSAISSEVPAISRTTTYNTLAMLARKGLILSLDLGGGRTHYDGDTSNHGHFICTGCGIIRDLTLFEYDAGWQSDSHRTIPLPTDSGVEDIMDKFFNATPPQGVVFSNIQLTVKGLCENCNPANKTKPRNGNN